MSHNDGSTISNLKNANNHLAYVSLVAIEDCAANMTSYTGLQQVDDTPSPSLTTELQPFSLGTTGNNVWFNVSGVLLPML